MKYPCVVSIGCYGPMSPEVIDLQAVLIRKHNGSDVPIIVQDDQMLQAYDERMGISQQDAADARKRLIDVCEKHGIAFRETPQRCGHAGGDLGAFWHGIKYANELGYDYVVKLSFRFLVDLPKWIERTIKFWQKVEDDLQTTYPVASWNTSYGRGNVFSFRTECLFMRAKPFNIPAIMAEGSGILYPRPVRISAEQIVHTAVVATGMTAIAVGPSWFGPNRHERYPGIVWKDVPDSEPEYRALAQREGIDLGRFFHAGPSLAQPNHRW